MMKLYFAAIPNAMKWTCVVILLYLFVSCSPVHKTGTGRTVSDLNFIGSFVFPSDLVYDKTLVGGLSGIDYNAGKDEYYLVCDDRSDHSPARFYTAKIRINERGIDTVQLTDVRFFLQADGSVYPGTRADPFHSPDPEALRYDPEKKQLIWASEGERLVTKENIILQDPSLTLIAPDGRYKSQLMLPPNFHMKAREEGPRRNGVFEGLSFTENYRYLLVSAEEPIYGDGPRAGLKDSSAWVRILRYDMRSGKPSGQFGYRLEPVAKTPVPATGFRINGISDILAINDRELLVVERSFSAGNRGCTIKIFLADLSDAADISHYPSLLDLNFHPIRKKLLLNMDDLGVYIDNVEGVCFGPRLPDGRQSLVFVTDNNFSPGELTQFLLFELK